jgi:hypothetical protein
MRGQLPDRFWTFEKALRWSEDQAHERSWHCITIVVLMLAFGTHQHDVFSDVMPAVMCIALAVVFWRGERGIYPFNGRQSVGKRAHFLLTMIVFLGVGVALLNSAPAWWFPTSSSYWVFVPYIAFALLSALRGWRIDWWQSQ